MRCKKKLIVITIKIPNTVCKVNLSLL